MSTTLNPLLLSGSIVQVVTSSNSTMTTTTATIPFDNTVPQSNEGVEFMTVTITPKSATSILRVSGNMLISTTAANGGGPMLFKDSETDARWSQLGALGDNFTPGTQIFYQMVAGSTSAITFRIRAGTQGAGTMTFNGRASTQFYGGTMTSYLQVTEIAA